MSQAAYKCVICCCLLSRTAVLEAALTDSCDHATVKSIAKSRPVPNHLRSKIWQVVTKFVLYFSALVWSFGERGQLS